MNGHRTLRALFVALIAAFAVATLVACSADDDDSDAGGESLFDAQTVGVHVIGRPALADKVLGSWVGQMAGVAWGARTEFRYCGEIIPEDKVPAWRPRMVNHGFIQDDLYVEIPFLNAMMTRGIDASWTDFAEQFAPTRFPLAHANLQARRNLRAGIPAPESGHYENNGHADDIDWQIETDFIGALAPGRPNAAIDIAWRGGHVMNYGDGVYGGVFIAAMHAAAFFAEDLDEIIQAGREAVPAGSTYRAVIEDVIAWHAAGLTWEETWQALEDKWAAGDRCPSNQRPRTQDRNIDAKLNGAYVLVGLLYGDGDFAESMRIAMRCGQDSDCNPSSVGGILGNWMGFDALPRKFVSALNPNRRFLFTDRTLTRVIADSLTLAARIVERTGGTVRGVGVNEVWIIPADDPIEPPILEQWPFEENTPPDLQAALRSVDGLSVYVEAAADDPDGIGEIVWHFGDLSRARGAGAEHVYAEPGTYQVTAYAADGVGNTAWRTIPVTVP